MMNSTVSNDAVLQECLRAGRVITRYMGARLDALGLTPAMLDVLDVLREQEGISLNRLGDALCCVRSNVTALVDHMERDGLVERRRDPDDRRVIRLHLAPAGREKLAHLEDAGECCPETLGILEGEERRTLAALLRKLVAGLSGNCCTDALAPAPPPDEESKSKSRSKSKSKSKHKKKGKTNE